MNFCPQFPYTLDRFRWDSLQKIFEESRSEIVSFVENRCGARLPLPTGINTNFQYFFTSFVRFGKIRYGGRPQKFLSGSEFCEYRRGVPRTLLNGVHNFEVLPALLPDLGENQYQTSLQNALQRWWISENWFREAVWRFESKERPGKVRVLRVAGCTVHSVHALPSTADSTEAQLTVTAKTQYVLDLDSTSQICLV